jgi:hypothetical protein
MAGLDPMLSGLNLMDQPIELHCSVLSMFFNDRDTKTGAKRRLSRVDPCIRLASLFWEILNEESIDHRVEPRVMVQKVPLPLAAISARDLLNLNRT